MLGATGVPGATAARRFILVRAVLDNDRRDRTEGPTTTESPAARRGVLLVLERENVSAVPAFLAEDG